jgi:hypothetical protein
MINGLKDNSGLFINEYSIFGNGTLRIENENDENSTEEEDSEINS